MMEQTQGPHIDDHAPIAFFAYNRPWHTKKSLDALSQNTGSDKTTLYIYADGLKKNASTEEIRSMEEVRKVIRSTTHFKKVHILESEKNKGLANSVIEGVSDVVSKYKKVIVLEDDIITTMGFLSYMNQALLLYENSPKVFGISGYKYPNKAPLPSSYFLPIGCSWGWATWQRAWKVFETEPSTLLKQIQDQGAIKRFDFGAFSYYKLLQAQNDGKVDSWAIRFYASLFLQRGLFLYPQESLCMNIGMDGSGTHSGNNYFAIKHLDAQYNPIKKEKISADTEIVKSYGLVFRKHFAKKGPLRSLLHRCLPPK